MVESELMAGAAATNKNLRVFGLAFVVLFVLLAVFGKWVWKWEFPGWVTACLVLSGLFLIPSLFAPVVLRPLYGPWMKMGFVLGVVMTTVLMSLLYFIVVPVFSLIRLKDPLRLRLKRDSEDSYWEPHEMSDQTVERFSKPF